MNRWLPGLIFVFACMAWPTAAPVRAGMAIQRCQAADGAVIYTDRPCRVLRAKPVPLPGELAMRIARDHARERLLAMTTSTGVGAVDASAGIYADASAPMSLGPASPGRRAVAAGCARTPTQLQMDLHGALALGDVNRIAESYHWVGVPSRAAMRILDRLDAMARRPVAGIRYYDAWIGSGDAMLASTGDSAIGNGGILQVAFAGRDGGSIADFEVERYKGCYFVRF